jgi:hypothetical protein
MRGGFSEESLDLYQSLVQLYTESGEDYEGVYDFTRCIRPDGSIYGTKGRCTPPNKPAPEGAPEQPESVATDAIPDVKEVSVSMGSYSAKVNVNTKGIT